MLACRYSLLSASVAVDTVLVSMLLFHNIENFMPPNTNDMHLAIADQWYYISGIGNCVDFSLFCCVSLCRQVATELPRTALVSISILEQFSDQSYNPHYESHNLSQPVYINYSLTDTSHTKCQHVLELVSQLLLISCRSYENTTPLCLLGNFKVQFDVSNPEMISLYETVI